jgi:UDP-3-O-[3-hydroxymyristoyl] glucosamine N-acyltransferase
MTDDRFFSRQGPFTLGDIAAHAGARLSAGAPSGLLLRGIAALDAAGSDELSFFCDPRKAEALAASKAGAVITSEKLSGYPHNGSQLLLADDPRLAFAQIGLMFHPRDAADGNIDPGARIDASAVVGEGCCIEAGAVIGPDVQLGAGCHVGANAVIGRSVVVGEGSCVGANAAISHAVIGERVRVGCGSVIGGEGFGVVASRKGLLCSPQLGLVIIGDNVRIGGNCTIDRGAMEDTVIGAGTVLDNLVHIAHNVRVGRNCIFAGQVGVAGSTEIGDNVMIGGQAAISDHLSIGSNVRIAGKSGVIRDIPDGGAFGGYPAVPVRQWHRQTASLARAARGGD